MKIPLLDLIAQFKTIEGEVLKAVESVFRRQQFVLGPEVSELEREVARLSNAAYGIGVASGSDALLLALMALNIGPGDEVITSPYTFFATAGSIARLHAIPVFVDIDPKTYNIDPNLVEKKITKRTKAILPVHLFGQCAEMDPLLDIGQKTQIPIIEDAAQAIGATYGEKRAGSMGLLGCLSFFPSKNLGGAGDGGMVLTNDPDLAEKIAVLRVHGSKPKYFHKMVGLNSRLDTLQAAVLLVKLQHLTAWTQKRRENASFYDECFRVSAKIVTPFIAPSNDSIYNQYVIRVPDRDRLVDHLKEKGVGVEIYYPVPLHLQECFAYLGYKKRDFPESEKAAAETLALPIYPELTKPQLDYITSTVLSFLS
jgi:dTDP-4-amino-4,6-dideoxygalactose transaminase